MLRKILRGLGFGLMGLTAVAALLYLTRSNPIGPISGLALSGELVSRPPRDWSFTDEHMRIAVETRPAAPHSVTTICFTHQGVLYVPAQGGSAKSWTHYAVSNPRARILVGDKIYPVHLTRVLDESEMPDRLAAASEKYDFNPSERDMPEDLWLFRVDAGGPGVALP
jgi:hypothetical protein